MPRYEAAGFQPPAPVIRARVQGPSDEVATEVPLLIDTGADVSVIPLAATRSAGAIVRPATVAIQFYTGEEIALQETEVTVSFLRYRFRGCFLVAESDYGIAGRNILNLLALVLDGPQQTWSVKV